MTFKLVIYRQIHTSYASTRSLYVQITVIKVKLNYTYVKKYGNTYNSNRYSTVASTMTAQKIYACTPKMYAIRKCSMSAVTTAFTRTSKCKYQKGMGLNDKNDSSTKAWCLIYHQKCTQ